MRYALAPLFALFLFSSVNGQYLNTAPSTQFTVSYVITAERFLTDSLLIDTIPANALLESVTVAADSNWMYSDSLYLGLSGERPNSALLYAFHKDAIKAGYSYVRRVATTRDSLFGQYVQSGSNVVAFVEELESGMWTQPMSASLSMHPYSTLATATCGFSLRAYEGGLYETWGHFTVSASGACTFGVGLKDYPLDAIDSLSTGFTQLAAGVKTQVGFRGLTKYAEGGEPSLAFWVSDPVTITCTDFAFGIRKVERKAYITGPGDKYIRAAVGGTKSTLNGRLRFTLTYSLLP